MSKIFQNLKIPAQAISNKSLSSNSTKEEANIKGTPQRVSEMDLENFTMKMEAHMKGIGRKDR